MLRVLKFRQILALCLLTLPGPLPAQEEFQKVRDIYVRFWKEASALPPTSDNSVSEARRQKGHALPLLVEEPLKIAILGYLNVNPYPDALQLRTHISAALTPPSLGDQLFENSADVLRSDDSQHFYVVYDVCYCAACSKSWLGEFSRLSGKFQLVAFKENPLPDDSVHLAILRQALSPPALALYGLHWGDAHGRQDIRIFALDGSLREIWSKLDLPQGEISISGNQIRMKYRSALSGETDEILENYNWDGSEMRQTLHSAVHKQD